MHSDHSHSPHTSRTHSGGYTVLELVVVIALLVALAAGVLINSTDSRNIQKVDVAARQVVSALRSAQTIGTGAQVAPTTGNDLFDRGMGAYLLEGATNIRTYYGSAAVVAGDNNNQVHDKSVYNATREIRREELPTGCSIAMRACNGNTECGGNWNLNNQEAQVIFRRTLAPLIYFDVGSNSNEQLNIQISAGSYSRCVRVFSTGLVEPYTCQ